MQLEGYGRVEKHHDEFGRYVYLIGLEMQFRNRTLFEIFEYELTDFASFDDTFLQEKQS